MSQLYCKNVQVTCWKKLVFVVEENLRIGQVIVVMQLEDKPFEVCDYNGDNEPELFKPPILAG